MCPTGPGGQGRGRGCLPNQLLTSNETVKFIVEVVERIEKKEKVKNEKDQFCKQALVQKTKMGRAEKKMRRGRRGRGSKK